MIKRILPLVTLLALAFSMLPVAAARAQDSPTALPPGFGYTWDTSLPYQWVEIKGTGTPVVFGDGSNPFPDDAVTIIPIPIDFSFKYFEQEYDELYISTNGFISFNPLNTAFYVSQRIPMDNQPNNIIAPLWTDLKLVDLDLVANDSAVYYQTVVDGADTYLVIEFYNVFSFSYDEQVETLTFEIILHPNGDIDFIYAALNDIDLDTLTIGFEDAGGVEGYQALYNEPALPQYQIMRAVYPQDGKRVQAFPRYLSGFASHGEVVLPFTVHNTGTESVAYTLSYANLQGDSSWNIVFEDQSDAAITQTPTLTPGEDYPMQVRLTPPDGAQPGNYTRCKLIITSPAGGGFFEIEAQSAIATPFAQTFVDNGDGYVQFVTPTQNLTRKIFNTDTGAYFSLLHITEMDYMLAWEKYESNPQEFINLNMYKFLATGGQPVNPIPLEDHFSDPFTVNDSFPVMARTPNGQMGMAFLRQQKTAVPGQDFNNVYFGFLNNRGILEGDLVNLTQKPAGASERYRNLTVAVDPVNNHFVLAWEKTTPNPDPEDNPYNDIEIAIVNSDGSLVYGPTTITQSQVSAKEYYQPRLSYLSTGRLAVAYSIQLAAGEIRIGYALFTPAGSLVGGLMELNGYDSRYIASLTTAPLASGDWLIVWVNDREDKLLYVIMDNAGSPPAPAADLIPFGMRAPGDIETTLDNQGNVVMTWTDTESDYLYYTLFSPTGTSLTPPMAFRRGLDPDDPNIFSSSTGSGLSTCPEFLTWYVNLPVIRR